jgi:hypothetical protein
LQKGKTTRAALSLVFLFIGLAVLFFALSYLYAKSNIDFRVLQIGNLLLFAVGLASVFMSMKAMEHKNVQVFLRLVYGSFMMKFFLLALCAFIYIMLNRKDINKPGLFGCFALYFIYTFVEIRTVMKLSKSANA